MAIPSVSPGLCFPLGVACVFYFPNIKPIAHANKNRLALYVITVVCMYMCRKSIIDADDSGTLRSRWRDVSQERHVRPLACMISVKRNADVFLVRHT